MLVGRFLVGKGASMRPSSIKTLIQCLWVSLAVSCGGSDEGFDDTTPAPIITLPPPFDNDDSIDGDSSALKRADVDGDSVPDLVMTSQASIYLWLMQESSGLLSRKTEAYVMPIPPDSTIVAHADFDRDGKIDLVVMSNITRKLSILKLAGTSGNTYQQTIPMKQADGAADLTLAADDVVAGSVDHDLNGQPDLLIWNPTLGRDLRILEFQGLKNISVKPLINTNNAPGPNYMIVGLHERTSLNKWQIFWQAKSDHPTVDVRGEIYQWTVSGVDRLTGESGVVKNITGVTPTNLRAAFPWIVKGVRQLPGDSSLSLILQDTTASVSTEGKFVRWRFNPNLEYVGFDYLPGLPNYSGVSPPMIQRN